MASLTAIRQGLKQVINNGVRKEIFVYDTVTDLAQLPAAIVEPGSADFDEAFQRGMDCWHFNVFVLCSRADAESGQEQLDGLVTGAGPNSIRRAIEDRDDLGLNDGTTATVISMKGYGGSFEDAKISLVGAVLQIRVITDGRA